MLIRRAFLDLIGLPPSAEDVERFQQDDSPGAFERVVDALDGGVDLADEPSHLAQDDGPDDVVPAGEAAVDLQLVDRAARDGGHR